MALLKIISAYLAVVIEAFSPNFKVGTFSAKHLDFPEIAGQPVFGLIVEEKIPSTNSRAK